MRIEIIITYPRLHGFSLHPQLVTEIENMRHRVTESRQEVYNLNEHEVTKRWSFEEGVSSHMVTALHLQDNCYGCFNCPFSVRRL